MQLVSNIDTYISLSLSKAEGHVSNNYPLFIVPAGRLIVSLTFPDQ